MDGGGVLRRTDKTKPCTRLGLGKKKRTEVSLKRLCFGLNFNGCVCLLTQPPVFLWCEPIAVLPLIMLDSQIRSPWKRICNCNLHVWVSNLVRVQIKGCVHCCTCHILERNPRKVCFTEYFWYDCYSWDHVSHRRKNKVVSKWLRDVRIDYQ